MGCSNGKVEDVLTDDNEYVRFEGHVAAVSSFNVLIVGATSVGKSCMLRRATTGSFPEPGAMGGATVGVNCESSLLVSVAGITKVKMMFFDTGGQERFAQQVKSFARLAHVIIFAYDITSSESFDRAVRWTVDCEPRETPRVIVKALVGTRLDQEATGPREVSAEIAAAVARDRNMYFIETSAKDGRGIIELFQYIARTLQHGPH